MLRSALRGANAFREESCHAAAAVMYQSSIYMYTCIDVIMHAPVFHLCMHVCVYI